MQQQPQQNQPSLRDRIEFVNWLATFPALTAMLLCRRNLGYRLLSPLSLLGVSSAMALIAMWPAAATPNAEGLAFFAFFVLFLGLAQRTQRWKQMRSGMKMHSYDLGYSHLDKLPAPSFLTRNRRLERFVDPALCSAAGVLVWGICPALGGWLVLSGLSLRLVERVVWQKQIDRSLDTVDGLIEAEIQEEVIEHYSIRLNNQSGQPVNGIPTGCSADIQKTILRRKPKS